MSKRSVEELVRIGVSALGSDPTEAEIRLVRAVAAIVGTGSPRSAKKSTANLPIGPGLVFSLVAATGKVICAPVDKRWFGRLGGVMTNITVLPEDVVQLCDWLTAGGVDTWPTGKPTFANFIQQLDKWLGYSTEWNSRGRPALGKRSDGSVGRALPDVDWGDFRRGG